MFCDTPDELESLHEDCIVVIFTSYMNFLDALQNYGHICVYYEGLHAFSGSYMACYEDYY